MRLKKEAIQEREQFIWAFFRENPDTSIAKANSKLKEKFKSMMSPVRAAEIRKLAVDGKSLSGGGNNTTPPPNNGGGGKRNGHALSTETPSQLLGLEQRAMPIISQDEEQAAVERVHNVLRSIGAYNIKLSYDMHKNVLLDEKQATG